MGGTSQVDAKIMSGDLEQSGAESPQATDNFDGHRMPQVHLTHLLIIW